MSYVTCAIVLTMLQLATAPALAAEQSASNISMKTSNYTWWHGLSARAKETALRGAIVGIAGGWFDGYREARSDAENALDRARLKSTLPQTAATIIENGPYPLPPHFSKSLTVYRRAVDAFYANNPRKRSANVFIILMCLSDRPTCVASNHGEQRPQPNRASRDEPAN
jgi:hypothetical protein